MTKTRAIVPRAVMTLVVSALLGASTLVPASAQDAGAIPPRDLPQNGGAGIRTGHITSTGATVPNPGASQGAGTTSLDIGVQREDSRIQSSICKGC